MNEGGTDSTGGAASDGTIRIAMWSGPRNISTAMMRAFENRPDTTVIDEPFYGAYLAITGVDHPMRAEILRSGHTDWRKAAAILSGPAPGGKRIFFQKHMTHHMVAEIGRDWMAACRHAFLIRDPDRVLASYQRKRASVSLADSGFVAQAELFETARDLTGVEPPVVEADRLLADPPRMVRALCAALGIGFDPAMLAWPPGRRASDGVWAAHWYDAVERSTGFAAPAPAAAASLTDRRLKEIARQARPYYEQLAARAIGPAP